MPRRLVKGKAAETDLIGIWTYSFEQWGEAPADRYLDALERGIRTLADDPEHGRQRDELRKGHGSKRIEHHAVFYTVTHSELRIRRVLHESRDVGRHL